MRQVPPGTRATATAAPARQAHERAHALAANRVLLAMTPSYRRRADSSSDTPEHWPSREHGLRRGLPCADAVERAAPGPAVRARGDRVRDLRALALEAVDVAGGTREA